MGIKNDEVESVEFGTFETSNESGVKTCDEGFTLNSIANKCEDIDECLKPNICKSDRVCFNTDGSYACDCHPGFKNVHDHCLDINECTYQKGGCSHFCENTKGSYNCFCPENSWLSADDRTCIGDNNKKDEIVNDEFDYDE